MTCNVCILTEVVLRNIEILLLLIENYIILFSCVLCLVGSMEFSGTGWSMLCQRLLCV